MEYLEQSIKIMEYVNSVYERTTNESEYVKIDDIKRGFEVSEYYGTLTKIERRRYTKSYLVDFFKGYKPLSKNYRERCNIGGMNERNVIICMRERSEEIGKDKLEADQVEEKTNQVEEEADQREEEADQIEEEVDQSKRR